MKTFFAGVFAAVLGGVALFLVQDTYVSWKKDSRQALDIAIVSESASLDEASLKKLTFDKTRTIQLMSVEITNTGSEPVISPKVAFSSNSDSARIQTWGKTALSDAGPKMQISPNDNGFVAEIDAIDPEKSLKFWVAYDCCTSFAATTRTPDLKISQTSTANQTDPDKFLWWVGLGVVALLAFTAGAAVENATTAEALRKRGLDVKDMLTRPVENSKERKDG